MALRVNIKPGLLAWAAERSGIEREILHHRFPMLAAWLDESMQPTLKQLEAFAKATYTPSGLLFLPAPPKEEVPIPDYRTLADADVAMPSVNLLDTLHLCMQRQDWYRDYVRGAGTEPIDFIGSASVDTPVDQAARSINERLGSALAARQDARNWEDALKALISRAEDSGVLVMCSGIVMNNTRRKLDPEEFRGFALTDELAPLVFINAADTKAAQIFTLAHELAHLWLGETALSDADPSQTGWDGQTQRQPVKARETEIWCNAVAAELLVPKDLFELELEPAEPMASALQRLARRFKVSSLVILRRMKDVGHLRQDEFMAAYREELNRLLDFPRSSGGNFYLSQPYRLSRRFSRALIASAMEGHTLYRDALRMLGVKKLSTLSELGRTLGVLA